MVGRSLAVLVVLVASVAFGDPGGHGSDEVLRRVEQGRGTTEQSGRQHKSLSSHPPAFDQVYIYRHRYRQVVSNHKQQ